MVQFLLFSFVQFALHISQFLYRSASSLQVFADELPPSVQLRATTALCYWPNQ